MKMEMKQAPDQHVIFYDAETTGFPHWKKPSSDPDQPHLVQLAAALVNSTTKEIVQSLSLIIRPDGWDSPDNVAEVHGITTERAMSVGVPEVVACAAFFSMWEGRHRIGHNEQFDARIMRIASCRYFNEETQNRWKEGSATCTGRLAKKHLQTKGKAMPNLGEAYHHFTGQELAGAHDAMVDVQACMTVYFGCEDVANYFIPKDEQGGLAF